MKPAVQEIGEFKLEPILTDRPDAYSPEFLRSETMRFNRSLAGVWTVTLVPVGPPDAPFHWRFERN